MLRAASGGAYSCRAGAESHDGIGSGDMRRSCYRRDRHGYTPTGGSSRRRESALARLVEIGHLGCAADRSMTRDRRAGDDGAERGASRRRRGAPGRVVRRETDQRPRVHPEDVLAATQKAEPVRAPRQGQLHAGHEEGAAAASSAQRASRAGQARRLPSPASLLIVDGAADALAQ